MFYIIWYFIYGISLSRISKCIVIIYDYIYCNNIVLVKFLFVWEVMINFVINICINSIFIIFKVFLFWSCVIFM